MPASSNPSSTSPLTSNPILPANSAGVTHAANLLKQGHLVVLPTETVYGIALNLASPSARDAAHQIKARASETTPLTPSPWVIHVATPDDLLSWVPHISALGRRLITKSLPGPVAFQIKLDQTTEIAASKRLGDAASETIHDSIITLRCPEITATQDTLAAVPDPVAIIGAGTRAQPAIYEVSDLPPGLLSPGTAGAVQAAIDGGPTRYRRSSTVVRIDGDHYSIIRPGVIDERILHRMADLTILFLCSGNTCRSPMAAAIATRLLADKLHIEPSELHLRHIVVQSAGLHASRGMRATVEAIDAVKEFNADVSTHVSQPATSDLLRRADRVYTMTTAHRDEVLELFPWAERKTSRFDPEGDISDPIGGPASVYQRVARRLATVLQNRLSELPI